MSAQQAADAANQAAGSADQAATAAQNAADAAGAGPQGTPEQQLSELQDMLDKGLITRQDHDAKKKQILGNM